MQPVGGMQEKVLIIRVRLIPITNRRPASRGYFILGLSGNGG
jgi:hypothetical protein